jgi:hypothetical protein
MNPGFHQAMVPNGSMMPSVQAMQQQPQQSLSAPFNLNATGVMQMYQAHQSQSQGWKAEVAPQERFGYFNELYAPAFTSRPALTSQLHLPQACPRWHGRHGRPELVVHGHQPRGQRLQPGQQQGAHLPSNPPSLTRQAEYLQGIRNLKNSLQQQRSMNARSMNLAAGQMPNQRQPGAPQMGQQLPNSNPGNQPLSHLQRPMQASPIPMPGSNGLVPQMPQQPATQLQGQMPQMMQQRGVTQQALAEVTRELMNKATPDQIANGERHFAAMPIEKQNMFRSQNLPPHYFYFRELAFRFLSDPARQQAAMQPGMAIGQRPPNAAPNQELSYPSFVGQTMNPQQTTPQQMTMAGNNFQMRGIGMQPNGMTQGSGQAGAPAMNRQPSGMNAQMQEQMRAQSQQQQLAAQMAQNREAMSMMGQMSSAGSMPMLTQSVSQPQQGISRPPTAMTPQQQNAMGMGLNMPQQQPAGASPERMMQARLQHIPPGLPQEIRNRLLTLPEEQFREQIRRIRGLPGGAANPINGLAQSPQLNLAQNRGQMVIQNKFPTPGPGQTLTQVPSLGPGQNPQGGMPSQFAGIPMHVINQLDQREFPRGLLAANNLYHVPDAVRTWAELKQWLIQNQSTVPNMNQAQLFKIQLQVAQISLKNQQGLVAGAVTPNQPGLNASGRIPVQQSMLPVTPEEINAVRSRPGFQHKSDDEARKIVQQLKMNSLRKMQQLNGQLAVPGGQQPQQQQQQPTFMQQSPPAPQPVQAQQPQAERMRKRPSSEAFEEGLETQTAPAVQHPTSSLPGGGIAASLRTPIQTSTPKPPPQKSQEDPQRVLQDLYFRVKSELKLPTKPLQVSPAVRKQYVDALKTIRLDMIDTFIKTMYLATQSIPDTKENMKARLLVIHNADRESGQLADPITVPWPDFKAAIDRCRGVMENYQRLRGGVKPQQQPTTTQSPPQPGQPQKRPTAKAPPAPTAAPGQNPFFPSAASPTTAQQYFDQIKPPDLHLPASKRAKKTGTSPPAPTTVKAPAATPKAHPPKSDPPKADPKPFKCPTQNCEFSQRGFESQALLDEHKQQLHANFSDPARHVTEIVASVLLGDQTKRDDKKTTPKGSPANLRKTSPKGSPAGGLRNTPQQKAPTSAPKNNAKEKEDEDPWKHAGMSAEDLRDSFNIEAFSAADHALMYGVDSSPSALTPSSSKDSSSTGSSTREATDGLLGEGKRLDPVTIDPTSMLVLTENLSIDFGTGAGALEALDSGGIDALLEHGIEGFKGLDGHLDGLTDGLFGDDVLALGKGPASGETVDLMDWTNLFGNDGGDDAYAIPGWAQDSKETTL